MQKNMKFMDKATKTIIECDGTAIVNCLSNLMTLTIVNSESDIFNSNMRHTAEESNIANSNGSYFNKYDVNRCFIDDHPPNTLLTYDERNTIVSRCSDNIYSNQNDEKSSCIPINDCFNYIHDGCQPNCILNSRKSYCVNDSNEFNGANSIPEINLQCLANYNNSNVQCQDSTSGNDFKINTVVNGCDQHQYQSSMATELSETDPVVLDDNNYLFGKYATYDNCDNVGSFEVYSNNIYQQMNLNASSQNDCNVSFTDSKQPIVCNYISNDSNTVKKNIKTDDDSKSYKKTSTRVRFRSPLCEVYNLNDPSPLPASHPPIHHQIDDIKNDGTNALKSSFDDEWISAMINNITNHVKQSDLTDKQNGQEWDNPQANIDRNQCIQSDQYSCVEKEGTDHVNILQNTICHSNENITNFDANAKTASSACGYRITRDIRYQIIKSKGVEQRTLPQYDPILKCDYTANGCGNEIACINKLLCTFKKLGHLLKNESFSTCSQHSRVNRELLPHIFTNEEIYCCNNALYYLLQLTNSLDCELDRFKLLADVIQSELNGADNGINYLNFQQQLQGQKSCQCSLSSLSSSNLNTMENYDVGFNNHQMLNVATTMDQLLNNNPLSRQAVFTDDYSVDRNKLPVQSIELLAHALEFSESMKKFNYPSRITNSDNSIDKPVFNYHSDVSKINKVHKRQQNQQQYRSNRSNTYVRNNTNGNYRRRNYGSGTKNRSDKYQQRNAQSATGISSDLRYSNAYCIHKGKVISIPNNCYSTANKQREIKSHSLNNDYQLGSVEGPQVNDRINSQTYNYGANQIKIEQQPCNSNMFSNHNQMPLPNHQQYPEQYNQYSNFQNPIQRQDPSYSDYVSNFTNQLDLRNMSILQKSDLPHESMSTSLAFPAITDQSNKTPLCPYQNYSTDGLYNQSLAATSHPCIVDYYNQNYNPQLALTEQNYLNHLPLTNNDIPFTQANNSQQSWTNKYYNNISLDYGADSNESNFNNHTLGILGTVCSSNKENIQITNDNNYSQNNKDTDMDGNADQHMDLTIQKVCEQLTCSK
ncbi:hypothetical protein GJ496_008928 [Pomphorhynchus laevis]|nr:hypothetical protein GJ496_008928 [Pomphorhynchus laevis]